MYAFFTQPVSLLTCLRALLVVGFLLFLSLPGQGQATERVSNGSFPSLSADGRYVAFVGAFNNYQNVFVKDRQTGAIQLVSIASDGTPGDNHSHSPSLSADGRYVAFQSWSSNLVPGDTHNSVDVFVKDLQTGAIERVSTASDGTEGNNDSVFPTLSADGRYVVFESRASNLVSGDTNAASDVFVKDRQTGAIQRVSTASDGTEGNSFSSFSSLSADGRYAAFWSNASNLVSGDTNAASDVFVKDRQTGAIQRVSTASDGTEGNGNSGLYTRLSLSADGRYVAFVSEASNLVPGDTNADPDNPNAGTDVFVKDRLTGAIERVSTASDGTQANYGGGSPSLSADGRYVAFDSYADNLVPGDTNFASDVFLKDRLTGTIERVSTASDGTQGNNDSGFSTLSADGRYVAFWSNASNLATGGTGVFVRGPLHASNYVTISGQITLEDLVPTAEPRLLSFTFRPTDQSGEVFQSLFVAPDGQFTLIGVPANTYQLHIESFQHLSRNLSVNASSGNVNNVTSLLRAGDANDDNSVDVLDLDLLIQAFDSTPGASNWSPMADFNGDSSVDVLDLDLLIRNFDQSGDL
jgi:Tol biopolymer transport system component